MSPRSDGGAGPGLPGQVWTGLAAFAAAGTLVAAGAARVWARVVGLPSEGLLPEAAPVAAALAAAGLVVLQTGLRVRPLRGILRRRLAGERVPASAAAVADLLAAPRRLARATALAVVLGTFAATSLGPAPTAPPTIALGMGRVGLALLLLSPAMLAWRAWLGRLLEPFDAGEVPIPARESLPRWIAVLALPAVGGAGLTALATAVAVAPPPPAVLVAAAAALALGTLVAGLAGWLPGDQREAADLVELSGRLAAATDPGAAAVAGAGLAAGLAASLPREVARRAAALADRYESTALGEEARRHRIEALQRRKTRFVAAMSHDLRSPLNAILGFADLLASGAEGALRPAQRESVAAIQRSGGALLELLGEVLDAARVDAGRLPLRRAWTPSVEILTEAVAVARRTVADRPLEVEATLQPGLPPVHVDRARIVQAVACLFRQASRVAERGKLGLLARVADGPGGPEVRVDVVDERVLIPGSERERLVAAFQRARERAPREGPVGLSLSLACALVRAHGGDVWLEEGPRGGTTFSVRLPLEPPGGGPGVGGPTPRGRATP